MCLTTSKWIEKYMLYDKEREVEDIKEKKNTHKVFRLCINIFFFFFLGTLTRAALKKKDPMLYT